MALTELGMYAIFKTINNSEIVCACVIFVNSFFLCTCFLRAPQNKVSSSSWGQPCFLVATGIVPIPMICVLLENEDCVKSGTKCRRFGTLE